MKIKIDNMLRLREINHPTFRDIVKSSLTTDNPRYADAIKMNRYTNGIPEWIKCYEETGSGLIIPRGFGRELVGMAAAYGEPYEFEDNRRTLPEAAFQFHGELRPYQQAAVNATLLRDWGVLECPTGGGKTTMALAIIAERKQPALIVVHTKELLAQWVDRAETFLGIPKNEIGIIGNGKKRIGDKITVALVQSLIKCAADVSGHIGFLIVDEAHHCPSRTFTEAVTAFDCKFMLGLTATPYRRDDLTELIHWYLGETIYRVNKRDLIDSGNLCHADVIYRATEFTTWLDPQQQYSKLLSELTQDQGRNRMIAQDAAAEAAAGQGVTLVISDRKGHCQTLYTILRDTHGIDAEILTGDLANGKRIELVERVRSGAVRVLFSTGALIGEGIDLPDIKSVLLATPIKFDGRLVQYIGRALRPAPGKDRARIYDYVDANVGVLEAAAKSRLKVYRRTAGIEVHG